MDKFLILRAGEEIGVYTQPQLRKKVQRGEVLPTDELQREGSGERYEVKTVPSLAVFLSENSNSTLSSSYSMAEDSSDESGAEMDSPSFDLGSDDGETTDSDNEISEDAF